MYESTPPPGIIIGLAYNSYGGSILYIETCKYKNLIAKNLSQE